MWNVSLRWPYYETRALCDGRAHIDCELERHRNPRASKVKMAEYIGKPTLVHLDPG